MAEGEGEHWDKYTVRRIQSSVCPCHWACLSASDLLDWPVLSCYIDSRCSMKKRRHTRSLSGATNAKASALFYMEIGRSQADDSGGESSEQRKALGPGGAAAGELHW
jgi:hypothetical protein